MKYQTYFYEKNIGFKYKNHPILFFFYESIPILTQSFIIICSIYLLYLFLKFKNIKKIITSWAFFLIISAAIGPGLTVNLILKDNFGRARPREIIEFGGCKIFTPAPLISYQCYKNCSLSSGHAAMGYYFSAISYVFSYIYFTRIYIITILFGSLVGLTRIIMGAHFASDVVISAFIVLLSNHLIYILWKKKILK